MPGIPLRRRLFVLTAAGILPLAIAAGIGLVALRRQQEAQAARVGLELAGSVASAVDAELRRSIAVLETLGTTPTLDRHDLPGFRERAVRVLALKPEWLAIVLSDPDGRSLVDTRTPAAGVPEPLTDHDSFHALLRERAPVVGELTLDAEEAWHYAVRAPVHTTGDIRYVVSALVKPDAIRDAIARLEVPSDWVVSIVDANGLRVARSRAHEENLGGRLSATVQQVVDGGGGQGFGVAYALEGERIFTPYSRLSSSGWMAVLGIPTAVVDAAVYRSLAVYIGGLLLSLVLGTIGALWVARGITKPIADLRTAAEALGRRETPRPLETSLQELRDVGAALKTAGDELALVEAQREDLLRKERQAREVAELADRTKEEFMAVLSHELRTPLNAVYGWGRMLQSGQLHDEALIARAQDAIVRNADIQVKLIDDLLDLSRITSGKMRLEVRPVELPDVLQGALDAVRPAADAKRLKIDIRLDPDVPLVTGDAGRLQQVVWNLLMNAVKFTPSGGEIRLRLESADDHVQIVVSDTGIGIGPAMLPHVFERFRQGDSSSTRPHGGLGLGLALVKHLVELHGGSVLAQSEGLGKGATFVVTLPAAPAAAILARDQSDATDETPSSVVRLDGVHVLVADDDAEAVSLVETMLAGAGAQVRACLSAGEAVELLRRFRPDVLVSDIEMPGEDGHSLIRKVRALAPSEGGQTPAIALTAYNRPQDRLRSLTAGFNMHVPKPVDPGELTAIIADLVGESDDGTPPETLEG